MDCKSDGSFAIANVYESLDFQYSNCDEPSFVLTHYYISLFKVNGEWLIASVESDDDLFYQNYRETGFDLQREIAGVDGAFTNIRVNNLDISAEGKADIAPISRAATDITYIAQNAINYAMTYSTSTDSGSIPTYKNDFFAWNNASCMLFASQCVWAGLAGSNTQSDINNKRAMDASGSYEWWSTGSNSTNWMSCSSFRTYVSNVKSSSTETGVVCDTYEVPYNSDAMSFSAAKLKGAVLHVKGSSNGSEVALGHAVFVNNATGSTRNTVYVTAYNNCRKNVLLSTSYPSSTTNTNNKVFVIAPSYFRGGIGAPTNYLYGDLQNALVRGPAGVTATLYGRSVSSVSEIAVTVYAPGSTTPSTSNYALNKNVVSVTYNFTTAGTWRVVVSGTGLTAFTFTVRVT